MQKGSKSTHTTHAHPLLRKRAKNTGLFLSFCAKNAMLFLYTSFFFGSNDTCIKAHFLSKIELSNE